MLLLLVVDAGAACVSTEQRTLYNYCHTDCCVNRQRPGLSLVYRRRSDVSGGMDGWMHGWIDGWIAEEKRHALLLLGAETTAAAMALWCLVLGMAHGRKLSACRVCVGRHRLTGTQETVCVCGGKSCCWCF